MTTSPGAPRRSDHRGDHRCDDAISSIVAEILLVALAIALAAGAWVFFSGFTDAASPDDVAKDAVRAKAFDLNDDNIAEWIKLSLVREHTGPFQADDIALRVTDHASGAQHQASDAVAILCNSATATSGSGDLTAGCDGDAENFLHASSSMSSWEAGGALYIPCQSGSAHTVTLTLGGTLVLDAQVGCGEKAA